MQAEKFRQGQKNQKHVLNSEKMTAIGLLSIITTRKFNDPLQAITNILGGIHRRGSLDPEDLPLVDLAYQELQNLNKLVREMREIYLPSHGRTEKIDMVLELHAVIAEKSQQLSDKEVNITTEFTENMVYVHVIADQLRTVLQCLLDNVIKTCGQNDTLHISIAVDGEIVILRLESSKNNTDCKTILQFFESLDSSNTKESSETVELAKSYAIITMHGGTITAQGAGHDFTGFQVNFPIFDVFTSSS